MGQGISMMGGSGGGGMGGGFDWLSFAQKIGDINQTAYDQDANTSFSAVADPAGWMYQTGQKAVRFINDRKQQKTMNAFRDAQKSLIQSQTTGQNLQNKEEERRQQWNSDLRRYLYGGRR